VISGDLEKMQEQSFFHDKQDKKKFTIKHLLSLSKKLKTFYHFSRLYLNFPEFCQVWKIAGQISRLFQEFKTLYEPCFVVQWYLNIGIATKLNPCNKMISLLLASLEV